ncbi:hypothetical protein DRN73_02775 [Candidatus Pacearchaeota archaeon]|nr:MAG: hypothetical protein DRN73_02775 [Candidatus Pacearchaeota archaeon]
MKLRFATKKDFEKFLPLKKEFFKEYKISDKSKRFILKEFENYLNKSKIVLAIENKEILGYLLGKIEKDLYEESGNISEIFVKKEFRGKGISTRLKDTFLNFLHKNKISICRIEVNPNNPAKKIYEKWGFKVKKYRMDLKL